MEDIIWQAWPLASHNGTRLERCNAELAIGGKRQDHPQIDAANMHALRLRHGTIMRNRLSPNGANFDRQTQTHLKKLAKPCPDQQVVDGPSSANRHVPWNPRCITSSENSCNRESYKI